MSGHGGGGGGHGHGGGGGHGHHGSNFLVSGGGWGGGWGLPVVYDDIEDDAVLAVFDSTDGSVRVMSAPTVIGFEDDLEPLTGIRG